MFFKFLLVEALDLSETYLEPFQTSETEPFAKRVNSFQPFTTFVKLSIWDVWQGSKYNHNFLCAELWLVIRSNGESCTDLFIKLRGTIFQLISLFNIETILVTQLSFTCSNSTIETQDKDVKYVQS